VKKLKVLLVILTLFAISTEGTAIAQSAVANINGVNVYSDKAMTGINNTEVTFSDGSWADVATGEVVNNGTGYINIGAPASAGISKKTTYGPERFTAQTLDIININADVEVSVIDGDQMTVTIEGPESEINNIGVNQSGSTLAIQGKGSQSGVRGTNVVINGSSSISIGGGSISIGSGGVNISTGGNENATKLFVGVPKSSAVRVVGVQGKAVIGDTEGPLHASVLGSEDIRAGKVGDATLSVQGSGDINVSAVNGNLSMNVQGSGDIRVKNGSVNQLSVNVMGSGDARFDGEATNANLSVMGSGDVDVESVKNKPFTNVKGGGDINVGNW
jgi:hypothetical protein